VPLGDGDTSYPWAPMGALLSLLAFVSATSQRLHQVSIPALILQSHGDPTVLDAGAVTLLSGLGTPASDKRIFWLQRSGHELLQAVDRGIKLPGAGSAGRSDQRWNRPWRADSGCSPAGGRPRGRRGGPAAASEL
jgi:hypothetical protein